MTRLKVEALESRELPSAAGLYAIGGNFSGSPRVKVFNTTTNVLVADFQAYESSFTGGVTVAVADVTNDGLPEIIVGAGVGGGPRVRVFDGRAFFNVAGFPQAPINNTAIANGTVLADFFAYEQSQRGGVYVTGGNTTGTANAEVIVGAGPGGGPRVRMFDGTAITARTTLFNALLPGDVSADFFAYESSFRNGVLVSVSPTFGGTSAQYLATAPGFGGAPRIRMLNGLAITQQGLAYTSFRSGDTTADFFSGDPNSRSGAFVSTADFNRDGAPDVAVGTGAGLPGTVTLYSGSAIQVKGLTFNGVQAGDVLNAFPVGNNGYTNGVSVGAAVEAFGLNNGLLIHGFGGNGITGRGTLSKYQIVTGGIARQTVNDIVLDGTARSVSVGN